MAEFSFVPGFDEGEVARADSQLRLVDGSPRARDCALSVRAMVAARSQNPSHWGPPLLALLDSAIAASPQIVTHWLDAVNTPSRVDRAHVAATCDAARRALTDPPDRLHLEIQCASTALAIGDTLRAIARYRALAVAVRRDGNPALHYRLVRDIDAELQILAGDAESVEAIRRETIVLARALGDWRTEVSGYTMLGRLLISQGEPARAMSDLDRALAVALDRRSPQLELSARVLRGRALSRAGRTEESLADLRRAVAIGTAIDDVYELAEAWHNLAHAYERLGRWPEAAAAADRFIAITTPFKWDGLRVIALRDAGEIKRKAGWHAAANVDYERMVAAVREQDNNHQWAGEYLERRGSLREAAEMYAAGIRRPPVDPLDLAGLARVYTALGRFDSAAVVARAHDAARRGWRPGDVPVLPDVLARQGRLADATRILAEWAAERSRGGDVQAAALAHLAWGRMALRSGARGDVARAAVAAESLATLAAAPTEAIGAQLLGVRLLALEGAADSAVVLGRAILRDRFLEEHPGLRFEAALATGDASARAGRTADALAAYRTAANVVDTTSVGLDADLDRASFRDRHLAPFDSALALLLREPELRAAALLDWSARRKAAALRTSGERAAAIPPVNAMQARLAPGTLFLDYLLADGQAHVIAMTRTTLTVHRLGEAAVGIAADVGRARRGLDDVWLGEVDLARVRTDSAALRRLSRALLDPVAGELRAARRVLIAADGALAALPFEMLPDPVAPSRPLLLAASVGYVPGAWAIADRSPLRAGKILIVAQEAPGVETERRAVRDAWRSANITELVGPRATEEALHARRRDPDILHVVAHAVNDRGDPAASHLRLAAGRASDGYLHTVELGAWDGAPALVILSACATAAGTALSGEGAFSLSRAFLRAGAREVVATHWPIGPSAARLAAVLHERLAAGAATIDALTDARRALYADPATRHPFYWASFVLLSADTR